MNLPDRLHCPDCKARLTTVSASQLQCTGCERTVPLIDGIADFAPQPNAAAHHGASRLSPPDAAALLARIQATAGQRWPHVLGDTIAFGCGETTHVLATTQRFHTLLVCDTDIAILHASRTSLAPQADAPVGYATLAPGQDVLRDAVADTVIGTALRSAIHDERAFLATVYRALKPGGRAAFVVPNRRYHEAMARALAEALVHRRARDGAWPEGHRQVLESLARTRRLLIHRTDRDALSGLAEKHLFDSEQLQDMASEVGFANAEMLPLDPDPIGAATIRQVCQASGAPDDFTEKFSVLAAAVGRPFFSLLSRQDCSAAMLLWLEKAPGPAVRIFTPPPSAPPVNMTEPEAALGGAVPRWSVELLAHDTPEGIRLTVGGWCLCNTDIRWVRLTLDGVAGRVPVWRPRPDVHDVLNRTGLYHPLNTLCSGLDDQILFHGVHPTDNTCPLRLELELANGLVVAGPAPDVLPINEQMVIAH
jgi:hypothetical protein